jgi:hypothetical protein
MGNKRVLVAYGVDIDAVAGWLGSYGGEESSNDISRGEIQRIHSTKTNSSHWLLSQDSGLVTWEPTSLEALREI